MINFIENVLRSFHNLYLYSKSSHITQGTKQGGSVYMCLVIFGRFFEKIDFSEALRGPQWP